MTTVPRYKGIDTVKLLMALVVVAIHTTDWKLLGLTQVAVPFFFLTSGFLLFGKWNGDKEHDLQATGSWMLRIAKLYLVWTALYLPFTIYGFIAEGMPWGKALTVFLRNLVFVGENYLSWPLWYLLAMIWAGALIWIMRKLHVPLWGMFLVGAALFVCAQALPVTDVPLFHNTFRKSTAGPFESLFFLTAGGLLTRIPEVQRPWPWAVTFGVCLTWQHFSAWAWCFTAAALFLLARDVKLGFVSDSLSRLFARISRDMYLSHMIFAGLFIILLGMEDGGVPLFFYTLILSVAASLLSVRIGPKINGTR